MSEHEELRTALGAYLIGSLAPAERAAVERHLARCAECRAELTTLAPLPGLLGRLSPDEARSRALTPAPDLLARTLDTVRARRRAERRRLLRWRLAAAAAAAVAVVAAGTSLWPSGPPAAPLVAVAGAGAAGTGSLEARGWGTAVELDVTGLPVAPRYVAVAVARDGRGEVAATWGATPSGRAVVSGATAIPRAELAAVEVRTADGRAVLTLPG